MDAFLHAIADKWIYTLLGTVFIVGILGSTLRQIVRCRAQERTRREIAAYIAEGSMTPEQGEKLMRAKAPENDD